VPTFILCHAHDRDDCGISIASWKAYDSFLRRGRPFGSCATGGHRVWWILEAADRSAALDQLPPFVRQRTIAEEVREVLIP